MKLNDYIDRLNTRFRTGISREHSYRGDLQNLLESIADDVLITNEPARISCGAPDYIITKGNIPVGYIEAKDIGADLNSKIYKEQFGRYRKSLNNLIITDYLDFQLFRDGEFAASVSVGKIQGDKIIGIPENYSVFISLIRDFCTYAGQTVKSASKLSEMMAGKARLLADVIEKALLTGSEQLSVNGQNNTLKDQFKSFRQILIHDITEKEFAGIYAQTIAYGMFAARLHDRASGDFSRQKAAELIPESNPFLRKLFQYIAGYDLDDRIKWIVDALADIFRAADIAVIMKNFGKATQQNDPVIHFYETFLSEYDPALRKSRGVWYTPEPVVNFIVRAVDDILKTEFGLACGLADTAKTKITVDVHGRKIQQEVHKVQILDPAAGTGTFLAEVVKHIYREFEGQQGIWNSYADEHLIPRLNGFEILMAPYAMAHLKLDLLLSETGYRPENPQRLRIFLTNSLEEHHPDTAGLFASWLSREANEANHIKRDTPVMVVLGNPPYAVSSSNKGEWIQNLIADYKKDLNEKKINLDDDYIKFIRFGENLIDKSGGGILAFISNNSFIDGVTHRQMRKHLLETFDKIYILDLHGSAKKNETAPDGSKDENVFDIMQGVSVNIFVRTEEKSEKNVQVFHSDCYGKREEKYNYLNKNTISSVKWKALKDDEPYFFFVPKDFSSKKLYYKCFKLDHLFICYVSGFQTKRDKITIQFSKSEIQKIKDDFTELPIEDIRKKYQLPADGRDWKIEWAKNDIISNNPEFIDVMYRPFDNRKSVFTGKSKGFIAYPREEMVRHLNFHSENISLITCRQQSTFDFQHVFLSGLVSDMCSISSQTKETGYIFPLYLYQNNGNDIEKNIPEREPNLDKKIVTQIARKLRLKFTPEKNISASSISEGTFAPIDILDYIYAVLHSPAYREKYREFLKIDFPRVPYPKNTEIFWQMVNLGGELRQIHLLESPLVEKRITTYPQSGENIVVKPRFENNKVWINQEQYFDNVPEIAWEFYIGGYQPAQKWLKDRKGRKLDFDDILHYQKIIAALSETDKIMKEIDKIDFM